MTATAPEPAFARDGASALYWSDPPDPLGPVCAFLATDPEGLGPSPVLTATWSKDPHGAYVFLGAPAADTTAFLGKLTEWLSVYGPSAWPRFLWVSNADDLVTAWAVTQLGVHQAGGPEWRLDGADFMLADYQLAATGGGVVAPGALTSAGWGFEVGDSAVGPALLLYTPTDLFPARSATSVLSMAPGHTGSWRFVLDAPGAAGDGFARLGAGMRYFTPGPDGFANAVHFAVLLQPPATDVALFAEIDPLRPLDGGRTSLGFFPWDGTAAGDADPGELPTFPSGYATAQGYRVALQPQQASPSTPASARFVFAFAPQFVDDSAPGGYYLAPEGSFASSTDAPEGGQPLGVGDGIDRVVCGTSGLEYLGLPSGSGCSLAFVPGQPAFAPLGSKATGGNALTGPGSTSWVYVDAPADTTPCYYSQPEDAPLFQAPGPSSPSNLEDGAVDLLDFLELVAADLPAAPAASGDGVTAGPAPFPMAPFLGLGEGVLNDALAIEQLALAPRRRAAIMPTPAASTDEAVTARVGVTPQGLGVGVTDDGLTWTWLGVGHTGDPAPIPDMRFTCVEGPFQKAMQTNNLFMVMGNPDEFAKHGSVAYELSELELNVIATLPPDQGVPADVLKAVSDATKDRRCETRDLFRAALQSAFPAITEAQMAVFERFGGQLTPIVGGWPFRLSPDNWGPSTYLLFKFVLGRSVADLAADVSTWSWPEAASSGADPTAQAKKEVTAVIAAAAKSVKDNPASPYANFNDVVQDKNWTGVLALSVDVPLEELPDELQVLAAGIDPKQFRAHHFGMSVTPYRLSGGVVSFERSSMFGLIDYQNPEDQYFSENISFAFRVLQLTVGIRNSVVTTFSSRAELLVNRLFGAPARLFPTTHGNNVILDGAHQQQRLPDGSVHDTYVFSMSGENVFWLDGQILQTVELLSTQLVTAKAAGGDSAEVDAVFQMGGNLRFYQPPDFDPFCWGPVGDAGSKWPIDPALDGYLRFGNLGIGMTFSLGDPAGTTEFTLKEGGLSFDTANSKARSDSLAAGFPIRLVGLVSTPDPALVPAGATPPPPQTPADMGFTSVTAPLDQAVLSQPWHGLNYSIDLGTLGALAGNTAIAIGVLVAWSPGPTGQEPAVSMGVRLPGAKDTLGVSLPLQGVIKLGFKGIEFLVANDPPPATRTYTLRMRDFALRLLGLSFPPGHNDVILFGNPDQAAPSSQVGWYMAYASDADPKKPPPPPTRQTVQRLQTTARLAPAATTEAEV